MNLVDWCLQKCSSRSNLLFWWFNVNVVTHLFLQRGSYSARPSFTQSVRYSSWCVPSASSCSLNIAHLFVNVVGNCSKSNPGPLPLTSASLGVRRVAGLSAATTCQPPVWLLTRFYCSYDAAPRGPGASWRRNSFHSMKGRLDQPLPASSWGLLLWSSSSCYPFKILIWQRLCTYPP